MRSKFAKYKDSWNCKMPGVFIMGYDRVRKYNEFSYSHLKQLHGMQKKTITLATNIVEPLINIKCFAEHTWYKLMNLRDNCWILLKARVKDSSLFSTKHTCIIQAWTNAKYMALYSVRRIWTTSIIFIPDIRQHWLASVVELYPWHGPKILLCSLPYIPGIMTPFAFKFKKNVTITNLAESSLSIVVFTKHDRLVYKSGKHFRYM